MTPPRIRPPLLAVGLLGAAYLFHRAAPVSLVPASLRPLGWLLLAAGFALPRWALGTFHRSETTHHPFGRPARLVVEGPFRRTRNPMYIGVTILLAGFSVLAGTLPMLLAPAGFVLWIDRIQIPFEERRLAEIFGAEYEAYRADVPRWISRRTFRPLIAR